MIAAVSACEAQAALQSQQLPVMLSVQQVVNDMPRKYRHYCSKVPDTVGCFGTCSEYALEYIHKEGVCEESTCPYVGKRTKAMPPKKKRRLHIGNFKELKEEVLHQIKQFPICGEMFADVSLENHTAGVHVGVMKYKPVRPESKEREYLHAVLIAGFGSEKGIPYYWVQNSWGSQWGEGGFAKIKQNLFKQFACPIDPYYTEEN